MTSSDNQAFIFANTSNSGLLKVDRLLKKL